MATETTKITPKATTEKYSSVSDLLSGTGASQELKDSVAKLRGLTQTTRHLAAMRIGAGLTQEQMAQRLEVSQGCISKWEAGSDAELTIGQIHSYVKATGTRFNIFFGKPLTHVEAVKACAKGMRKHLSELAKLANRTDELQKDIHAFFGEAFFNFLSIMSECQSQLPTLPNGKQPEIRIEFVESPNPSRTSEKIVSDATQMADCVG